MKFCRKILGIIPSRMASSRFPGKPLAHIMGVSMIQRVFESALKCQEIDQLIIATDSFEIAEEAKNFGAKVCITSSNHQTGLERLIEVKNKMKEFDLFVNIQGDEPMIHPKTIEGVIRVFEQTTSCEVASSAVIFDSYKDFINPNNVKVVINKQNLALYFSRSPIPYSNTPNLVPKESLKHQGLYAYTKEALNKIEKLYPAPIEEIEKLEQLRLLYFGINIFIYKTLYDSIGVDLPEDIKRIEKLLKK